MQGREITFDFDKYKRPVLLNTKETIANTIINALFMVPGNSPVNPLNGVNIMQYMYKTYDSINTDEILTALRQTCGDTFATLYIDGVSINSARTPDGDLLIIAINLKMPDTREVDALAIVLKKVDDRVHFNYGFMSDVLSVVA